MVDAVGLAHQKLAALPAWKAPEIEACLRSLGEHIGWKPGDLFTPLRVAVTGKEVGFGIYETLAILGRERCLERIDRAVTEED